MSYGNGNAKRTDIQTAAKMARGEGGGSESTVIQLLETPGWQTRITNALTGTGVDPVRFKRLVVTAIRMNPDLQRCSQMSLLGSLMTAAQLGLEVNTPLGQAYLIPYKQECTLQIGYQGYMALARRSKQVASIMAHAVYDGDDFAYQLGLSPNIHHLPLAEDREDPARITHVYAYARFGGGYDPVFVVLTRKKVEQFRRRSPSGKSGPWVSDYEAMALKTAVKRLARWLPLSSQLADMVTADGAVIHYDDATGVHVAQPEHDLPPLPEPEPEPDAVTDDIFRTEGGSADARG